MNLLLSLNLSPKKYMMKGKGTKAKLMNPKVDRAQGGVNPANMSRMKIGTMDAAASRKVAIAVSAERIA